METKIRKSLIRSTGAYLSPFSADEQDLKNSLTYTCRWFHEVDHARMFLYHPTYQ